MRALGATALVIGGGGLGTGVVRAMALPIPVLVDRERVAYHAYGLGRVLHLLQESATFVVDREGIICHATRSLNPRASMDWNGIVGTLHALGAAPVRRDTR